LLASRSRFRSRRLAGYTLHVSISSFLKQKLCCYSMHVRFLRYTECDVLFVIPTRCLLSLRGHYLEPLAVDGWYSRGPNANVIWGRVETIRDTSLSLRNLWLMRL
jgi:hypothetical protein